MTGNDRELLLQLYQTALKAADPAKALHFTLDTDPSPPTERTWIVALGKAAHALAEAAVAWLARHKLEPAGGIVIAPDPAPSPHPSLSVTTGDHPVPGENSVKAAQALEEVVRQVQLNDEVWVLLSGGTTSLIASPVHGISLDDLRSVYQLLLASGLDITAMNRVRKRISRWGGGRLAAALAHARVRTFIVSDVIGDDIPSIASGPCSPDPSTAVNVRALLDEAGLLASVPRAVVDLLDRTERGMVPETPKAKEAVFRRVTAEVIASNQVALEAVGRAAETAGLRVRMRRRPIKGDARTVGRRIANRLVLDAVEDYDDDADAYCYLCGGETTVTLDGPVGSGGRCQELALSAAAVLAKPGDARITLLAAGTDGRDGPTDAAGAIVDSRTWEQAGAAGRDPQADLDAHNAYAALDAANALIRTGPTGTNVMDLCIAIVRAGT